MQKYADSLSIVAKTGSDKQRRLIKVPILTISKDFYHFDSDFILWQLQECDAVFNSVVSKLSAATPSHCLSQIFAKFKERESG